MTFAILFSVKRFVQRTIKIENCKSVDDKNLQKRKGEERGDRSMDSCIRARNEREREAALRVDAWSGQRAGHDIAHVLWIVRAKLALIIPRVRAYCRPLPRRAKRRWNFLIGLPIRTLILESSAYRHFWRRSLLLPHLCHESAHDPEFERGQRSKLWESVGRRASRTKVNRCNEQWWDLFSS